MNRRPHLGHAVLLGSTAAATTWAALLSWRGFVVDRGEFLLPLVAVGLVVALSGAFLRWLGAPLVVTVLGQVVAATAVVSENLTDTPLPVGDGARAFADALRSAVESAQSYQAPVAADVPSVAPLLVVSGAVFMLLVDLLACTLRRVPIAGLALLAVYSVPAGLVTTGPGWLAFVGAAVGFLTMLHLDARDHLLRWGRPIGPDEHNPWTADNPVADAVRVGAGRIGVTATALALVVPPFLPVLDLDLFGFGPGDGDGNIEITRPLADMRRDLERGGDVPLIRITTDDPDPDYLRVAVLNRFTGTEWSSGDRDIASNALADGPVPLPPGLSRDVPTQSYEYRVDVTYALRSEWLPTQFPVSVVEAEGAWHYDPDTMDFLGAEGLDTAGLSYQMTALEPQYGVTGQFFEDADDGAVGEEVAAIPGGLPAIVRDLAMEVTAGATTDYERALRLQNWFREEFRYSLEKAPEGVGGSTFQTFLEDAPGGRVGYCEQFASAMAAMARIVGIPARVAVGFLEPDPIGTGRWEYSSHDLHSWPELYFEGAGWVGFEPTPQRRARTLPDYAAVPIAQPTLSTDTATAEPTRTRNPAADRTNAAEPTPTAAADEGEDGSGGGGAGTMQTLLTVLAALLVVLLLLGVLALAPRALRRRVRERRLAGGPDDVWDELYATAVDLEVPWPAGRSPRQVGAVLLEHLGDPRHASMERPRTGRLIAPDAAKALARIVGVVERTRYGRPGATVVDTGSLHEDAATVIASLEAGATRHTRTRGTWVPQSLWKARRAPSTSESRSVVSAR